MKQGNKTRTKAKRITYTQGVQKKNLKKITHTYNYVSTCTITDRYTDRYRLDIIHYSSETIKWVKTDSEVSVVSSSFPSRYPLSQLSTSISPYISLYRSLLTDYRQGFKGTLACCPMSSLYRGLSFAGRSCMCTSRTSLHRRYIQSIKYARIHTRR